MINNFMLSKIEKVDTSLSTYNYEKHSKPSKIALGLTNKCNLKCKYCFVNQDLNEMTLDIAYQSINWGIKNTKNPTITLFGGEPLLKFYDLIVPLLKKYPHIHFNMSTNGVLLTENIIDFLSQYNITLQLSFDGIEQIQNTQRNNSFNEVLKHIPYLLKKFPDTLVRATLLKNGIPYLYQSVKLFQDLGFKQTYVCENKEASEVWDEQDKINLIKELLKIKNLYIKTNFFYRLTNFNSSFYRCGLGTTSCAVTPKGDIVPCVEYISTNRHIIGNVFTGINKVLHENYLLFYQNKINNLQYEKENFPFRCWRQIEDNNFLPTSPSCVLFQAIKEVNKKEGQNGNNFTF